MSLCLSGALCAQQTTTVSGTLINPDGSKPNGTMVIRANSTFQSADGYEIKAGLAASATILNGYFSVNLVPNIGATPSGTSYQVSYSIGGQRAAETWIVPISGPPVSWSRVYTAPAPPAAYAIGVANLIAPPNCLALGGFPVLTANGWTCSSSTVSVSSPLTYAGGTIALPAASSSQNGYLSSADWSAFHSGSSLSYSAPLSNNAGTISMPQASSSQNGYLSSADWSSFHSGSSLSYSAPLSNNAGTIAMPAASSSQDGYLASIDWSTFNGKQAVLGFTPENLANKNQANGYAGLDSSALLPHAQLPALLSGDIPDNAANTSGAAGTAAALAATPTACTPAAEYSYGNLANGNALCNPIGMAARSVSGAADTVASTDNGEQINCNYAPGCAETLPTATTLGVTGFQAVFLAAAGASTVTPAAWPIYPGGNASLTVASLTIPVGYACGFGVDPSGAAWDASCHYAIVNNSVTLSVAPSAAGNVTVAHGLGRTPIEVQITMTSSGAIWCQATCYDGTNVMLAASDAGLTATVRVK